MTETNVGADTHESAQKQVQRRTGTQSSVYIAQTCLQTHSLAEQSHTVLDCSPVLIPPWGPFPAGSVTNTALPPSPFSNRAQFPKA